MPCGLSPIPEPKVDLYKPPQGSAIRTVGDPADPEVVAADPNDCGHDVLAKALDATKHLLRRPRRLRAEYHRVWLRAVVRSEVKAVSKLDAAVFLTAKGLKASERTVWSALAELPLKRFFEAAVTGI